MTPLEFAHAIFKEYDHYRLDYLTPEHCKHGTIIPELHEEVSKSNGLLSISEIGHSFEGRSIHRVSFGKGPVQILLWSQMHGDEPTATLALMDVFAFLSRKVEEKWMRNMLGQITVHAIPLLNPDGAERFRRYTAMEIDMNRDARSLVTPEARILRDAQRRIRPTFGFNLHDQGISSVGTTSRVAAVSLLAPALDEARSLPMGRIRAVRLGAFVARTLRQFALGHLATYDDAYEPRAFGDAMQSWGTSTLLIESGQWPGDPEKRFIRKLNFVALVACLRAIGDGSYQDVDLEEYRNLKPNGKRVYDVIVKNLGVTYGDGQSARVDLGFLAVPCDERTSEFANEHSMFALKEIGDLKDYGTMLAIDASARTVSGSVFGVENTFTLMKIRDILQL